MTSKIKQLDALGQKKLLLSRAIDTTYEVPSPTGKSLLPFQRVGVEYASFCENFLNADPPGVGKTIQSIGYMNKNGIMRALILCPASLLYNWKRELEAWHLGNPKIEIFNPKTYKGDSDITLMSYYWTAKAEAVKIILKEKRRPLLILDEVQNLKNLDSKRTKYTLAKNGLKSIAEKVHCLSGTPILNRPVELWPVIGGLCPEAVGHMSFFEYGMEFCAGWKTPWNKWDFTGKSNLHILGPLLRSHFMVRRLKTDVLKSLPERYPPNVVYLDQTSDSKKACQRLELFDEDAIKQRTVTYDLTEMSRARYELGISKVPASVTYITEILRGGHEKILIFAHHKDVISALERELSKEFPVLTFTGSLNIKERDARIQAFQNTNEHRAMILSITAGGVGITLTKASYVIFVEFSWVPGENEQAIDRVHRIGQTKGVITDYLVFENSLDERQLKYCFQKQEVFNEIFQ